MAMEEIQDEWQMSLSYLYIYEYCCLMADACCM